MGIYYNSIVVPTTVLLPIAVAIYRYSRWRKPEILSFQYLILSGIFNIIAAVTSAKRINNLPLLHLYTVLEFCMIAMLLRSMFSNKKIKRLLIVLMILFIACALIYVQHGNNLYSYNILPRFAGSIIITIFCMLYLMLDLTSNINSQQSNFNFQIIVGLLIYFSSSSILFLLSEALKHSNVYNVLIWNIHATFVMIMYIIFALAFFRLKQQP